MDVFFDMLFHLPTQFCFFSFFPNMVFWFPELSLGISVALS